ncbi:MAG: PEP-CTERM sorting domain-containing protein [Fimbriimonadaceae bacterium]|uniref:Ice-binding protein C-terminal domain-containing protein n=1 Tax=Candidatus Nitrosymbiomonas proteolyticus TaxID=2608984 RepID=A0A809R6X9_9BACT|nr:MAG: PEP-CTERM sorting domain-containing protein [Armatimonadota bacterium]MCK6631590.1 PEP-CTERM sorting domain-containing protein [Fimbriimonadaceae bacterium]NUM39349.1 PEP-CTERM sorting domain-containing protein [Armatimonadota bacterium]BBO23239.1 conserved hypothetical protein [Candidatus Nitrosymbiomonas proteolyticus]HQU17682.1 PEP-CTERM sorting domain-containing protein [Fimbriimonadaceae bacterium]
MKKVVFGVLALASAAISQAIIIESEPNNTPLTANAISRGAAPWADVGVMSLADGGGDVDYFSITLFAGEVITAITTPLEVTFTVPDTLMHLLDSSFSELVFNDDGGGPSGQYGSAIRYEITSSGTYYIGVTGYGDRSFVGTHSEEGDYALTVSVVPEPATLLALGAGVAAIFGRRRKSS